MKLSGYKTKLNYLYFFNNLLASGILLAVLFISEIVYAQSDDFPAPPSASIEWVSKDMNLNGMPMAIRHFRTNDSVEDVLWFYRKVWQEPVMPELPGFVEATSGPWWVISRLESDRLMSVQVQPLETGQGAWGYLGDSALDKATKENKPGDGFPMMQNSNVLNDVKSTDKGKSARTLQISNAFSIDANASYYRNHYANSGWTALMDENSNNTWVQTFKNGRDQIQLIIRRDDGVTIIIANNVRESLF